MAESRKANGQLLNAATLDGDSDRGSSRIMSSQASEGLRQKG